MSARQGFVTKQGRRSPSLGPVSDLERHLPAEWWRTLFTSNYLRTDGDVVENADNTSADVDRLVAAAGLRPGDKILDLCCGQGRHVLELARRGYDQVTGVDRSRFLIRLARRRAKTAGLPVVFHEGDARRFRLEPGTFDCVCLMGNSFGYFEHAADDKAVLTAARRALRPGGILVMDLADGDWMRENLEMRSWEWIDDRHFVVRERCLSADGDRVISRELLTHVEQGVLVDQFYAERLYSAQRLAALLAEAGFERFSQQGDMEAQSQRNQDLGLMAHRMFYAARRPATVAVRQGVPEMSV
ncbi:MAG: class I SAM-dependent methyltransferase [Reyranella sp.]|jgi:D-alanine-D-alanine ligase|nr:MAG: class I SAM-dependent methyltransferase [Reyranella sp.]